MANTIKIKRSAVSGKIPTTTDVELGELAINTYDGKLFLKKNDGTEAIVEIGAGGGGATSIDDLSDGTTQFNENVGLGTATLNSLASGGQENTGLGYAAGQAITTNDNNTLIGSSAGQYNSASNNTAVGRRALRGVSGSSTGSYDTAIGISALTSLTTATYNVGVGPFSLNSTTTGSQNIGIGLNALYNNTTGGGSTAVGHQAGYSSTGGNNTFLGYEAGDSVTTGTNNTVIGNRADASSATVSNEITLGNSSIATLRCNTQTISSLSDGRDKTEIEDLPLGLDFIDTLRPVRFKWKTRDGNGKDGTYDAGFIAQDLQSAQSAVDADYLNMIMDENPDRLEARYGQLIPVLVQAIKDLKVEIDALKSNA